MINSLLLALHVLSAALGFVFIIVFIVVAALAPFRVGVEFGLEKVFQIFDFFAFLNGGDLGTRQNLAYALTFPNASACSLVSCPRLGNLTLNLM